MRVTRVVVAALSLSALAITASAQPRPSVVTPPAGPQVAWFGTWAGGLAEAKRTKRPILLVSAAPHCRMVPGVW